MPKKKVSDEIKKLFAEAVAGLEGWRPDSVDVDRMLVESNTCPHCWRPLEYRGWTNLVIYRAFGICKSCKFARHFWDEGGELSRAKKEICKRMKKRKSAAV